MVNGIEAQFMKKLSNTEAQLKKTVAYKKSVYPLHYSTYNWERYTLLSTLSNIDNNLLDLTKPILTTTLLFGSNSFDIDTNTNILNATMN